MITLALLFACTPEPRVASNDRADIGETDAHEPLATATLEGDVAEGLTATGPFAFASFRVIVTADPSSAFEYRFADGDDWSDWQAVTWDWSYGPYRNGHQVLPGAVDAVQVRASNGADFVEVELFEGSEPVHDDDGAEGVLLDVHEYGRAISGEWTLSSSVWSIGQGWYLPYESATHCVGAILPGSAELGQFLVDHFGASSYQGYNCRYIGGTTTLSVHSSGRAIDVFVPTDGGSADNDAGDPIGEYLVAHAEEIGISLVIWDRASWGAHRSGDKHQSYGGVHPHHDHLHIELTTAGANRSTPWFTSGHAVGDEEVTGWIGIAPTVSGDGYWTVHTDGRVDAFGGAPDHGDAEGWTLASPMRGVVATPSGDGYWLYGADGGVFSFGDAGFHGSLGGVALNAPIVGMASTPSGGGYWMVAEDGGVFAFGDAGFYGSMGGTTLNAPVVGLAATPSGAGYWLAAEDGGIFAFGDAGFYGSMGGTTLNAPVSGIAASSAGYWMTAEDGGIFAFGDAGFYGSMGGTTLNAAVSDIAATPSGAGYWMIGLDGGIFTFGDAGFHGSSVE
jgi:hypothetical protein